MREGGERIGFDAYLFSLKLASHDLSSTTHSFNSFVDVGADTVPRFDLVQGQSRNGFFSYEDAQTMLEVVLCRDSESAELRDDHIRGKLAYLRFGQASGNRHQRAHEKTFGSVRSDEALNVGSESERYRFWIEEFGSIGGEGCTGERIDCQRLHRARGGGSSTYRVPSLSCRAFRLIERYAFEQEFDQTSRGHKKRR